MRRRLKRSFYARPTLIATRDLLGKYLVRKIGGELRAGKIVETEAYIGPLDRASHAYGGKVTPRNRAEYLVGGHVYIYLVYGMYWQLNISTSRPGRPECVLLRALEPVSGDPRLANGPGKLCRWMKLDGSLYGEDVTRSSRVWVEDRGVRVNPKAIVAAPRIGIDYAGPTWARKRWRFYLRGNPAVSKS
ncbi:MAG: DNA-3-methyladenine glycosylase [Parcubacteria group bacterium Gr01-1014_38]|nr:MAG: DNA-3-methyladenine glycosylase [Parcubacteria group bacterium Gr01-1014_38]